MEDIEQDLSKKRDWEDETKGNEELEM